MRKPKGITESTKKGKPGNTIDRSQRKKASQSFGSGRL